LKKVVTSIGLLALFCLVFSCRDKEAMTELEKFKARAELEGQNKAIVLRWFKELSKDNFGSLYEELFSPESKQYMPPNAEPMSFEEFKPMAKALYQAFPVIEHSVVDIVAEGDKVAATVLVHTIHEGAFAGMPGTGKKLEWTGIAIFQIKDGKIQARWEIADILGLYEQLGLELKSQECVPN
jgi:steroid delta-isomerase-like uncharacterized protein